MIPSLNQISVIGRAVRITKILHTDWPYGDLAPHHKKITLINFSIELARPHHVGRGEIYCTAYFTREELGVFERNVKQAHQAMLVLGSLDPVPYDSTALNENRVIANQVELIPQCTILKSNLDVIPHLS